MQELDYIAIGNRVKKQREALKYTREKFSEVLSISVKHLREIEIGVAGMSIEVLNRMSKTLKLPVDYILYGKELTIDEQLGMMIASCDEYEKEAIGGVVTEMVRHYNRIYKDSRLKESQEGSNEQKGTETD